MSKNSLSCKEHLKADYSAKFVFSIRKAMRLSRKDFAALIGKSESLIVKWERETSPVPTSDVVLIALIAFMSSEPVHLDFYQWASDLVASSAKPSFSADDINNLSRRFIQEHSANGT